MSAQGSVLTPQAQETLEALAKRYGQQLAETAVAYIFIADPTEAQANREALAASLYLHIFNGAAKDEIIHHLGFLLEVAELRSIEALRPRGWDSLARALPKNELLTGGE